MLRAAIVFFVLALIAGFLGFGGIASDAAWMGKVAFLAFMVVAVVTFFLGGRRQMT